MANKSLFWLLLLLLIGTISLGTYFTGNAWCDGSAEEEVTTAPVEKTIGFTAEDGDFKTQADSYFRFAEGSYNYVGLTDSLENSLARTATYLNNNPDRTLIITGLYKEEEPKPSLFPDLGLARANVVKKKLEALSANTAQLAIDSELTDSLYFENGYLANGIFFDFEEVTKDGDDRLTRIKEDLVGEPLSVYFETGDATLKLTQQQKEVFADMIYYLDRKANSYLEIGGHTDNQGDEKLNEKISERRARSVSTYIQKGGINEDRIDAVGYGESKPMADNKYEVGRKQNRRVEIIIKEK